MRLLRAALPWLPVSALAALWWAGVQACPFRWATGIPCPGCGLVRASFALVQGDVAGALALHPLVPVLLPVAAIGVGRLSLQQAGVRLRPIPYVNLLATALAVAMVGVWGWRVFLTVRGEAA